MIAATSLRRSAPRFLRPVVTAAAGHEKAIYSAIGSQASNYLQQGWKSPLMVQSKFFSTAALDDAVVVQTPGSVTKKLRVLNMDTVKNILKELNAVDRNSDGR